MPVDSALIIVRAAWITLAGMMLFSRVAFQIAGPAAMRTFLDWWMVSLTHRAWGVGAFLYGVVAGVAVLLAWSRLGLLDIALGLLLVVVLIGDGLLNLLPSSFGRFKERTQDAWVRRHGTSKRAGDTHLFGTINLGLGLVSGGMMALVILYRPISGAIVSWALLAALLLTGVLVASCVREGRSRVPK